MRGISIILVTYNSRTYIESCLDSIFAQDNLDFDIIVVDNGSNDGTTSIIKNRYPELILIENQRNLGPCSARNQDIAIAKGRFILCLDDDVMLDRDFLVNIQKAIETDRYTGTVQPKLFRPDGLHIDTTGISLSYSR